MGKIRNPFIIGGSGGSVDLTTTQALVDRLGVALGVYPYTVTNTLTNCTTNNNDTIAQANSTYVATISPSAGYAIESVVVTMGGVDITSTSYSNGIISIASVTGNVEITATGYTYTVTNILTNCQSSNDANYTTPNSSYTATITALTGYFMEDAEVYIEMDEVDITSTAYNNGVISIASVTGDLIITITAIVEVVPTNSGYITFTSLQPFTLSIQNDVKQWDGKLYKINMTNQSRREWDATPISSVSYNGSYIIALQGEENTRLRVSTNATTTGYWKLEGADVSCTGNIENLLDWETVYNGYHPPMATYCFVNLFRNCTNLISAPTLGGTTLSNYCYSYMFFGCTNLISAPALPAVVLAQYCYQYMFSGCSNLTSGANLSNVTALATYCCQYMYQNCTSLIVAPNLPKLVANYCYRNMFAGCKNLESINAFTTNSTATNCYSNMFNGCRKLDKLVNFSMNLTSGCYSSMYSGCSLIRISTTQDTEYTTECFYTTATIPSGAVTNMFSSTGGIFKGTPARNTRYYTANQVVS